MFISSAVLDNFGGSASTERSPEFNYTKFISSVKNDEINKVIVQGNVISGRLRNGESFKVVDPGDPKLVDTLFEAGVEIEAKQIEGPGFIKSLLLNILPLVLFIGVWIYLMRQMQGGGKGGAMSFGKSKARMLNKENNSITFEDVAGVEEAKEEVQEIVDFLRDPSKFQALGGRIPQGVLLTGSPGTGKTLLAKAIAGEADVPFFSISGSDFVEMFVGVGASRVRDMFEQAKKNAPCIIFIDEIDAVGRKRGSGVGGGNDEREQTLNQLLVEMDGFEGNEGVIVIAATNRPDVLDPALMRPGRFDRQVHVPLPDILGREFILKIHSRKVPLGGDVDLKAIARTTPMFSGAQLENLVNEAALFAARAGKKTVNKDDFEKSREKVVMGPERRSAVMSEEDLANTAYHESGHTVVAKTLEKEADPVHKVTIIPRGRTLGFMMSSPEKDKVSTTKKYLLARIAIALGGRIAEEVFVDQMSTGASSDFQSATETARNMVVHWGMSDKLGTRVYSHEQGITENKTVSEDTAKLIDDEINGILTEQYERARKILEEKREIVESMTKYLLEWETLDSKQIDDIMKGIEPKGPEGFDDNPPSGTPSSPEKDNKPDDAGVDLNSPVPE
jgi:cell division protease FtsH